MGTIRNGVRGYEVTDQGDYLGKGEVPSAEHMKPMPVKKAKLAARKYYLNLRNGRGDRAIAGAIYDVNDHIENGGYIPTIDEFALEDALRDEHLASLLESGLFAETVGDLRGLMIDDLRAIPGIKKNHVSKVRKCMNRHGLRLKKRSAI